MNKSGLTVTFVTAVLAFSAAAHAQPYQKTVQCSIPDGASTCQAPFKVPGGQMLTTASFSGDATGQLSNTNVAVNVFYQNVLTTLVLPDLIADGAPDPATNLSAPISPRRARIHRSMPDDREHPEPSPST